ncbi:MAG TPA: efflux RND transporter periplasmic adaptor subunit [Polyangiaceae bacterium]|nr:efflux RND transporter periplasmic adaptor subunit [Polyangiaceae bacterium]
MAAAKIRTTPVTREVLAATIDLPGEIASNPNKTARISALVAGRIETVSLEEGQTVKKGDVLAVIKVPELAKAKAAYAATAAKAATARINAERLSSLVEKRLAASQEVLAAQSEADALEAEARAAQEQLSALGTVAGTVSGSQLSLRAPMTGIVVSRDAVVGQSVTAEQSIATIADLAEVWFLGRVFEKNLGEVHVGAAAEIELNAYPNERFSGKIDYLGKRIDPAVRTIVARVRIANRGDLLRLGLFGTAHVSTEEQTKKSPTLVVPRSAVTDIGDNPVVFVAQPDGDFDVHEVVLGDNALGKVEVVSGLREGENVVVDGAFTLKSIVLKSTFGEDE